MTDAPVIVVYDGVCGLCNRLNRFLIARDRNDVFRLASLQSVVAHSLLQRHGLLADNLDTFYLVVDAGSPRERIFSRSEAVVEIMRRLGPPWSAVGGVFALLPRFLRDWHYNQVAKNRYRIFGHYDVCPLPAEKDRRKFIEV